MLASAEVRRKWVLSVEDWAEIRRLHRAERMPIKVIARVVGCSKNTVKKALAADQPPAYRRRPRGSVVDAVEPRIRELLRGCPTIPATVIAERIGWSYSIRTLSARVSELRPVYLPLDPASRTSYVAGEVAQCDFWFPPIKLPVGFGQIRTAEAAAGVDHDHRLCPMGLGAASADTPRRGLVCRLVAAVATARRSAAGAGLGR
jgi:transposase